MQITLLYSADCGCKMQIKVTITATYRRIKIAIIGFFLNNISIKY